MYKVINGDIAQFVRFLSTTDSAWVNIILTEKNALLIQNTSELFAVLQLNCTRSQNESNKIFRVKSKLLKALIIDGSIEIVMDKQEVHLDFVNKSDVVQHSVSMPIHQAFTSTFNEKLSLLQIDEERGFYATNLKCAINMSKITNSYLEICDGVLGITERDGTIIYSHVKGIPDICLTSTAASKLLSCSNEWYRTQNYVYAVDGAYGVIATQCRGSGMSDIVDVVKEESKSALIAEVDFARVIGIFKRCSGTDLILNFRESYCKFGSEQEKYKVPVAVESLTVSEKYNESEIKINGKIILDYISKAGITTVKIYVKKHHLRIDCGQFCILCRKGL